MDIVKTANLGLRFLLELALLVVFGYWGFRTGGSLALRLLLGIGAPVLAAVVWGMLLAPHAAQRLSDPWRLFLELAIYGLATLALLRTGGAPFAVALAGIYLINKVLMTIWGQ